MTNPSRPSRIQWKWVWISVAMFIALYVLPLAIASWIRGEFAVKIIGGWIFAGVVVVSGLGGYFSKGVTIWEPAIAGAIATILSYAGLQIIQSAQGLPFRPEPGPAVVFLITVFGLSLLGAGLGEGVQHASSKLREHGESEGSRTAS